MTDEERPPYKLTTQQEDTWDRFEQLAEAADTDAARTPQQEREQAGLRMLMAMLDHQLKASHYDNALISALAVMGISEDGGWVDIRDYTGKYSAVVKVARMLVIQQACSERRDKVARLAEDIGQDAAEDGATSLFQHVRRKVRRFMTRTSGDKDAEPTPMDWILETRTYGMHIQFNTASAGVIDWVGDRVSYRRVQFTMGQLSDALHELVREARGLLAELTMTDGPDGTEVEPTGRLPDIPWASISDDHSETKAGYSFISDDRNEWVRKADGWLFHRIAGSAAMRRRWGLESSGEDGPAFQPGATREYKHTFEQFRERLWMLLHTLGGQPGRATEMGGLRMVNTANGGVRNVFIHDKMACFVTAYHKGYRATSSAKVIHRYLPREVGELLVWYLWLVLPFWQEVEGITTGSGRYSAFLWADETVQQASGTASAARDADAESMTGNSNAGEGAGPADEEDVGAWSWKEERTWTTDRARRIMQRTSARLLGNQVNVSMWRHIAIGIANRYLNEAFGREREDGRAGGNGDDEDDELGDSAWDLQAGHSTRLAGMIYARELMQFGSGLAAKRQQFRQVSRQWHRFLGFGAEDRGTAGGGVGTKRKAEAYDGPRLEARLRRFERLRRADFTGQLRQMTGDESSEFRGNQRQAVLAIANGHSPVVQVMGTGGGKSVSFMLPAFCSPDGVTVVITPLVALRTDMHMRCVRAGITSHVWQSRKNNQAASIVFVTPESAITKGFRDFIARLQGRQALDRVVVDECHVVLEGTRDFRPQLGELGRAIREFGVQIVCLTATLPPADETAFFRTMRFEASRVTMFRAATTRKNISYAVVTVDEGAVYEDRQEEEEGLDNVEVEVCRFAAQWATSILADGGQGKAVVYANSIERVERIGKALGCAVFFSSVDSAEGKAARLKAWRQSNGAEGVIVATNALGLGIDIPDVRLVLHADMPTELRRFVQESGRAGRDGRPSVSVVVHTAGDMAGRRETTAEEYLQGVECRRVVLDRVMDGRTDRFGCEDGEELCDVCRGWSLGDKERDDDEKGSRGNDTAGQAAFHRQERQMQVGRWQVSQEMMRESEEVDSFLRRIYQQCGKCLLCSGEEEDGHEFEQCPRREADEWRQIQERVQLVEREMFSKKRFERFSGCFNCGLPQDVCARWEAEAEDGGRFRRLKGAICQFSRTLVGLFSASIARLPEAQWSGVMEEAMEAEGVSFREQEDEGQSRFYQWLGGL
ncbi:hypothetical protein CCHR01_19648 [Colletotrichum chrysophilum]|uniref:DNA 3'-5' helicase n=1 Tax=Colletotrichum chrysophilum TaxID=1836956 RepID=A0AAD8ZXX3_9PEZI|nr:hypothetical protein CCHR01_19648 [Colletotrichum chrysophilum]